MLQASAMAVAEGTDASRSYSRDRAPRENRNAAPLPALPCCNPGVSGSCTLKVRYAPQMGAHPLADCGHPCTFRRAAREGGQAQGGEAPGRAAAAGSRAAHEPRAAGGLHCHPSAMQGLSFAFGPSSLSVPCLELTCGIVRLQDRSRDHAPPAPPRASPIRPPPDWTPRNRYPSASGLMVSRLAGVSNTTAVSCEPRGAGWKSVAQTET
jgi:hypothetical protein